VAEARAEAEEDFDREVKKGKGKGKRKRKVDESSGFGADDDLGTLFGGATTGKLPRFANRITVKVFPSETQLLCRNVIDLRIKLYHRFVTLVTTHSTARLSGD
jgi:rRNA biogenesis protein RRP5